MSLRNRKRVLIVGAGAAGMSSADTLAQHPEDFDITIIERAAVTGGRKDPRRAQSEVPCN